MDNILKSKKLDIKKPAYEIAGLTYSFLMNEMISLVSKFKIENYIK